MDYPKRKTSNLAYSYKSYSFGATIVYDKNTRKKRMQMNSMPWFNHYVSKCGVGDKLSLYITNKKPTRTMQQNRYYWGAYLPLIAEETGNSIDDIHAWAKWKFLPHRTLIMFGDEVVEHKSSKNLTVGEFCDYIANIYVATGIKPPPTENYNLPELIHKSTDEEVDDVI